MRIVGCREELCAQRDIGHKMINQTGSVALTKLRKNTCCCTEGFSWQSGFWKWQVFLILFLIWKFSPRHREAWDVMPPDLISWREKEHLTAKWSTGRNEILRFFLINEKSHPRQHHQCAVAGICIVATRNKGGKTCGCLDIDSCCKLRKKEQETGDFLILIFSPKQDSPQHEQQCPPCC